MGYLDIVKAGMRQRSVSANVENNVLGVEITEFEEESPVASDACTCPKPAGPAGVGREYSPCPMCGYTWRCKDCGGCRQCGLPSRKVKTEDMDLPFPIGFGGLDSAEVARAERINLALGVTDPLKSKLSVVNWLYQHYRDLGNDEITHQLKQAYWHRTYAVEGNFVQEPYGPQLGKSYSTA